MRGFRLARAICRVWNASACHHHCNNQFSDHWRVMHPGDKKLFVAAIACTPAMHATAVPARCTAIPTLYAQWDQERSKDRLFLVNSSRPHSRRTFLEEVWPMFKRLGRREFLALVAAPLAGAPSLRGMPIPTIKDISVITTEPAGVRLVIVKVLTDQD